MPVPDLSKPTWNPLLFLRILQAREVRPNLPNEEILRRYKDMANFLGDLGEVGLSYIERKPCVFRHRQCGAVVKLLAETNRAWCPRCSMTTNMIDPDLEFLVPEWGLANLREFYNEVPAELGPALCFLAAQEEVLRLSDPTEPH